jgi:hypothetical protein
MAGSNAALQGKRVAILAAEGVEQVELVEPRKAVEGAGATTELLSVEDGSIEAVDGNIHPADTFDVDRVVTSRSPDDLPASAPRSSRSRRGSAPAVTQPAGPGADQAVDSLTFIGTATTLIRLGGFTLLTDPNFLHRAACLPRQGVVEPAAHGAGDDPRRASSARRRRAVPPAR